MVVKAPEYVNLPRGLSGDARRILELTTERTGKGFEFRQQKLDLTDTWASAKIARRDDPYHVILYHPDYQRYLGYMVAHECGHVLRMYGVPEEQRKLPAITGEHRRAFVSEFQGEILKLRRQGVPEAALADITAMWHGGIIRQLANVPVDMRIERWLYEDYAGLREQQVPALEEQMRVNRQALAGAVRENTPRKLYYANNAMNAAYARYLAHLLRDSRYFNRYRGTAFDEVCRRLGDELWEAPDRGYAEDMRTIERWSTLFGLDRWWEWRSVDD